MARNEADREDLIAEATAFVDRAEFLWHGVSALRHDVTVTAGFRANGNMTLYFDQDPFYQFDADCRLRRAFFNGALYRSTGSTLARLVRNRTPDLTALVRTDLTQAELQSFRLDMLTWLSELHKAFQQNQLVLNRSVLSSERPIEPRIQQVLATVLQQDDGFLAAAFTVRD